MTVLLSEGNRRLDELFIWLILYYYRNEHNK